MGIKNMKEADFRDNETLELFKKSGGNILMTSIDAIIDWGRSNSIWPLTFAAKRLAFSVKLRNRVIGLNIVPAHRK